MGKWKHKKVANVGRNQPLVKQIEEATYAQESTKAKKEKDVIESEKFVSGKLGKKILDEARRQQEDLMEEHGLTSKVTLEESLACVEMGNINLQDEEDGDEEGRKLSSKESDEQEALYSDLKISEEDEKALELFMNKEQTERKTLADYIQEKLKEKETEVHTQFSDIGSVKFQDLDDKIIELYKGVRIVLSRYRSGKIPKAFKVIPALSNWEQILALTDPNKWTSAAMLQATRLFTANLKEKMAQRFFNLILLPRIRDEIAEYKRLNVHMYQCLKKALFKPGAFYKGIVLPLCQDGDCSLREAVIISSVLAKTSVPLLHSCAAMLKIAEMDYSGANSIFLHTLLKKKYALPYRVIDALVSHFIRFVADKRELPVLWHQSLLAFVENYQDDISDEQKEALADLCKTHRHHAITPVILNHLHPSMANVEKMITS